jgi:hypothetical protein
MLGNDAPIDAKQFSHLFLGESKGLVVEAYIDFDALLGCGVKESRSFFHEHLLSITFTISLWPY